MSHPLDQIDEYPPFDGFPKEGIAFLRSLKRNNTREWFAKHKPEYEENVKLPMQSLILSLRPQFEKFAPDVDLNPKRSLFRIYRDTRFSADKTPYKTHIAAHFVLRGAPKGTSGLGYYVHIEPDECYIGGGIYMPDPDQLKRIRQAVSSKADAFTSIVEDRRLRSTFGTIEGERLKRIPKGFSEDDPMAEWLKLKQFFVGASLPVAKCYARTFVRDVATVCEKAAPLVQFLNTALIGKQ